jgi:hypothetical protein
MTVAITDVWHQIDSDSTSDDEAKRRSSNSGTSQACGCGGTFAAVFLFISDLLRQFKTSVTTTFIPQPQIEANPLASHDASLAPPIRAVCGHSALTPVSASDILASLACLRNAYAHLCAALQASLEPNPFDLRAQAAMKVPAAGAVGVAGVVRSVEARSGTSDVVRADNLCPVVVH